MQFKKMYILDFFRLQMEMRVKKQKSIEMYPKKKGGHSNFFHNSKTQTFRSFLSWLSCRKVYAKPPPPSTQSKHIGIPISPP